MGTFGEKFRAERERRNFTLDDVSNVTKISARMLKAIEDEHFDQLPGGVFNKGFIRAYAKHLRLNDEEAVTDYLACLRQAQIDAQTAAWEPDRPRPVTAPPAPKIVAVKPAVQKSQPAKSAPQSAGQTVPSARTAAGVAELPEMHLPRAEDIRVSRKFPGANGAATISWKVPAVVLAVILAGVAVWNYHSRSAGAEGTARSQAATQSAVSEAAPAASSTTTKAAAPSASATLTGTSGTGKKLGAPPTSSSLPAPLSSPTPVLQDHAGQSATGSLQLPSASAASASTPLVSGPKTAGGSAVLSGPGSSGTSLSNSSSTAAPKQPGAAATKSLTAKALPTFTLVIRAAENSWISVAADGQTVTQETLIAPAHTSARATREIVVHARNSAGVSFVFNGKGVAATGVEGEPRTFVFNATGLVQAAPTDNAQ